MGRSLLSVIDSNTVHREAQDMRQKYLTAPVGIGMNLVVTGDPSEKCP